MNSMPAIPVPLLSTVRPHTSPANSDIDDLHSAIVSALHNEHDDRFIELSELIEDLPVGQRRNNLAQLLLKTRAVRDRIVLQRQREHALLSLIEATRELAALHDTTSILEALVCKSRRLLGAAIAFVTRLDAERGDFFVAAADGLLSEQLMSARISGDAGLTAFVSRDGCPYFSEDYVVDPAFSHAPSVDSAVSEEKIRGVLAVPLKVGTFVHGVLFVCERFPRRFQAQEISNLSILATHACAAIENAQMFRKANDSVQLLVEANAQLEREAEMVQAAADDQSKLAAVVARGASLAEICSHLALRLQGRFIILDAGEQVICASDDDDASDYNCAAWQDKIHAGLGRSRMVGKSVEVCSHHEASSRVLAFSNSHGILGGLIVVTEKPMDEALIKVFERSAVIAGIAIASDDQRRAKSRRDFPLLLREIVDGGQCPRTLAQQTMQHGVDLSRPTCLIAIDAGLVDKAYLISRLDRATIADCAIYAELSGLIVILIPLSRCPEHEQFTRKLCSDHAGEHLSAVISKPVPDARQLASAVSTLRRCLDLIPRLGLSGTIQHESALALYAILFAEQSKGELESFVRTALGPLHPGDNARKVELAHTLLTYFDHGQNARSTAEQLKIHINTLRQRLDSVQTLINGLPSCERQLELHMALRLWRLQEGAQS